MSDEMVAEFMEEVNDKYYPRIMEGIDLMNSGRVKEGIEVLARPLHTIKGVTGFMTGFEEASTFTHKVESYLKKLSSDEVEHTVDAVSAAAGAVHMVFDVIERIAEQGDYDRDAATAILTQLDELSAGSDDASSQKDGALLQLDEVDGTYILRIEMPRIHLRDQRDSVIETLSELNEGSDVILDLTNVKSVGSTAWEDIESLAEMYDLTAAGMSAACKETFYSWSFDRSIQVAEGEDAAIIATSESPKTLQ